MTTKTAPRRRFPRPVLAGFVTGFAMAFVATILALAIGILERVHTVLVPASVLLHPLAEHMADWNGLLSMTVAGVVNGLVYAAAFALVATLLAAGRPQR
jgi:hypothetical protein